MIRIALALLMVGLFVMPVAAQPGGATAQQKVVLSYLHDVLDGGKIDLVENLFLADCVTHRPEGDFKGIAAVRGIAEGTKTNFTKFATTVHEIFDAGDRVVVRITHEATGAGMYPFRIGPQDVKNKSLKWDAIIIFRTQNGKISDQWVSRDELGMLLSAGVLKAPAR